MISGGDGEKEDEEKKEEEEEEEEWILTRLHHLFFQLKRMHIPSVSPTLFLVRFRFAHFKIINSTIH